MSPSLIQPCELCCGSGCDCIACVCISSLCATGPQTFVFAGVRMLAIGVGRVAPSNWFPEVPSCEPLCTLVPWSYLCGVRLCRFSCNLPKSPIKNNALPAWSHAWMRSQLKSLPRESRVFAWLLLHAALPCGGARIQYYPPGHPDLLATRCIAPACVAASPRPVETLEHLFLECPVGKAAMQWVCGLWQLLDSGPAPLFSASMLLLRVQGDIRSNSGVCPT
jgi:hypothetical protein